MKARRRGQPVVLLVALLCAWAGARAMVWQAPFEQAANSLAQAVAYNARVATERRSGALADRPFAGADSAPAAREPLWPLPVAAISGMTALSGKRAPVLVQAGDRPLPGRIAPAHQLLFIAGLGYATLAEQGEPAHTVQPAVPLYPGRSAPLAGGRWSADAWVLVRGGSAGLGAAGGTASYGGSQAGAVLRYRLVPGSPLRPAAYLRVSGALGPSGGDDREVAAGLALRPIGGLPVALLAEGRALRSGGRTHLRPALTLVSELPPQRLPFGSEAEVYAQAGYVGGRANTAFVDGQVTIDRPVLKLAGTAELRIGGGAWGGAQRGAGRLDVGPRASLRLAIGGTPVRAAADWRFRIAGNASPGSGPALTLSAGF